MELAHGLGEQVGSGVPEHCESIRILGVAGRQDLQARAVGQRQAKVLRRPVGLDQDGLFRELRADRAGRVESGGAVRQLELGLVGEDHLHRLMRIVGVSAEWAGGSWPQRFGPQGSGTESLPRGSDPGSGDHSSKRYVSACTRADH